MWHCLITFIALDLEAVLNVYVLSRESRNILLMISLTSVGFLSYHPTRTLTHYCPLGPYYYPSESYYCPLRPFYTMILQNHLSFRPPRPPIVSGLLCSPHICLSHGIDSYVASTVITRVF